MNIPFQISPSVSNLVLHTEESGDTYVEFIAWYKNDNRYEIIRFSFQRCVGSRRYSMGEEAKNDDDIGEVKNSIWLKELNELQRRDYPESMDNFKDIKHYYFKGHDCKIEILAEGYTYNTIKVLDNW